VGAEPGAFGAPAASAAAAAAAPPPAVVLCLGSADEGGKCVDCRQDCAHKAAVRHATAAQHAPMKTLACHPGRQRGMPASASHCCAVHNDSIAARWIAKGAPDVGGPHLDQYGSRFTRVAGLFV